jgi:retron-type reverse transcriptase
VRRGGGVCVYLRNDIKSELLEQSSSVAGEPEYIFIKILIKNISLLLGVIYCPPTINYFNQFECVLQSLLPDFEDVIIMGDFNTCILKNDARCLTLQNTVNAMNISILPLQPTHHSGNSSSLLDLIMTSNVNKVIQHGQLSAPPFSLHDLIYISYKMKCPKFKSKLTPMRSFRRIVVDDLRADAGRIDWSDVLEAPNIDSKVECFNSHVKLLYDCHAPVRLIRVKRPPAQWMSTEILEVMKLRDRARARLTRCASASRREAYRSLRNRCNRMCRDAKRAHFQSLFTNRSSSDIWRGLNAMDFRSQDSHEPLASGDLNRLNSHFATPPYQITDSIKLSTLRNIREQPAMGFPILEFVPVSENEVLKLIGSIKSTSVGADDMNLSFIKLILEFSLHSITHIINFSLTSSTFPSIWKKAYVIPLPKKPAPASESDYRPISILPVLSKIIEKVVHRQLSDFLDSNAVLSPLQSGFRSGHSTTTALVRVTDDIRYAMDNRKITLLVLLDFSSAFNTVDFDILIARLKQYNLSNAAISWFESYLRDREQCVRVKSTFSDWLPLVAGVPQGGILSPLLFSIFINTVVQCLDFSHHLYADDLQIYSHFENEQTDSAIAQMNSELSRIALWAKQCGLLLNPSKSQAILIGSSRLLSKIDISSLPALRLNGSEITISSQVKNLGIILDKHLSWQPQLNEVSRRLFFRFFSLRKYQNLLPISTKILLCQSLLLPIFDYADVAFLDITQEQLLRLERLQNVCIRFIFGLRKYDRVTQFRNELRWLTMAQRRDLHILSLLYSVLFNPSAPYYLRSSFTSLASHGLPLRSGARGILQIPTHRSNFFSSSFTARAARLWNEQPVDIRLSPSILCFKRSLKRRFLQLNTNPIQ